MFSALDETYSREEEDIASILEEGFELMKNVQVDERTMHKIAWHIKRDYQSKYDIDALTQNLTRVFAYLKSNKNVKYADMVRLVQKIAKPVLEESTDIDKQQKEIYDNFRNYLKGKKIRLNTEQKQEAAFYHGDYETFRKMNFGKIAFSNEGTYLDSLWQEICDNSYQMLDYDTSVADMPIALMDALNTLKPVRRNIFGMDIEQAAYDLALDIFRRFFVQQAEEEGNRKVSAKTARLIERQHAYRKRVKQEYDESLNRLREVEKKKRERLAEKYEARIQDLKESRKMALQYQDVKASNRMKEQISRTYELLAKVRQDGNTKIEELKARNSELETTVEGLKVKNRTHLINKCRNEDMGKYRERIKKNASGIITQFSKNADKKHVPEIRQCTLLRANGQNGMHMKHELQH